MRVWVLSPRALRSLSVMGCRDYPDKSCLDSLLMMQNWKRILDLSWWRGQEGKKCERSPRSRALQPEDNPLNAGCESRVSVLRNMTHTGRCRTFHGLRRLYELRHWTGHTFGVVWQLLFKVMTWFMNDLWVEITWLQSDECIKTS